MYLHRSLCPDVSVCSSLKEALQKPFWTFDVLPAEIPDVRIIGTYQYMGRLSLVARGDWIIGWLDYINIRPIYNERSQIICKNIHTGATPAFDDSDPFIMALGVYGQLPAGTPHSSEIVLPRFSINQSIHPGFYRY